MTEPLEINHEKIRLFAALDVPEGIREQLAALPRRGLDAKWQSADDFHITIRFLGDVEVQRLPVIEQALLRVRRPSFGVEVRGLNFFENPRQAILHAVVQSTRKMEGLCADVGDALTPLGFDFGARPFVPHITLARLKNARGLEDYIARHGRSVAAQWQAVQFHLMRSAAPDAAGRRYTALRSYPLPG